MLRSTAAERNAKLIMVDPGKISDVRYGVEEQSFSYGEEKDIRIHLAGAYQIEDASPRHGGCSGRTEALALQFPTMPSEEE